MLEYLIAVFSNKNSHEEHMGCVEPPCTELEDDAICDVSENTESNYEYALPVLFNQTKSDVEKQIHKDDTGNVPYVRMPCLMLIDCKRRVDIKRYLSPVSEYDINNKRKRCRN